MSPHRKVNSVPNRQASVAIGGVPIWAGTKSKFMEDVASLARIRRGGYICFATAHMIALAQEDGEVRRSLLAANICTADGTPVAWAARFLCAGHVPTLDGPSTMPSLLRLAEKDGLSVGFLGGRPDVLQRLTTEVQRNHPGLRIGFVESPPFRDVTAAEDFELVSRIESSGVRVLFVGLGSPKQERWMRAHRERLTSLLLGVGAAFDFYVAEKRMPPRWFQELGLTWLFRLLQEPRRLWRRNVVYSPRFVALALRDIFGHAQ